MGWGWGCSTMSWQQWGTLGDHPWGRLCWLPAHTEMQAGFHQGCSDAGGTAQHRHEGSCSRRHGKALGTWRMTPGQQRLPEPCSAGPLLSQAPSQPQIIAAFLLLLDPAPRASRLLGSWTQPGARRPIWIDCMLMCPLGKLCSRSERPPARCHGLVCITPCFAVQREGLGFSVFLFFFFPCSTFIYAARNPPCLPADSCMGRLRGCL